MRIEVDGRNQLRILGKNGEDLSKHFSLSRVEVTLEAQEMPTAVLHCYLSEGWAAEVDYANVAAVVTHITED